MASVISATPRRVTSAEPGHIPDALRGADNLLVYLPLSYAIGGYTVAVPREKVTPVPMNMEEAMRFTLTGGVTGYAKPAGNGP